MTEKILQDILERIEALDEKFTRKIDEQREEFIGKLDAQREEFNGRFDEQREEFNGKFAELDRKIAGIQLTLENDINKKIDIIAEGHLDLNRKLDEAISRTLEFSSEKEMMKLKLVNLESEIRELKKKA